MNSAFMVSSYQCLHFAKSTCVFKANTKNANNSKIAVRTIARRLSALRQFYRFLVSEGTREDDPTSTIESPKQGRTLPKTLSEDEVTRLIQTAGAKDNAEGKRLVCLLEMLYATGLRVSELVGLPLSAIGEDNQFLMVTGKAGRDPNSVHSRSCKALRSPHVFRRHSRRPPNRTGHRSLHRQYR